MANKFKYLYIHQFEWTNESGDLDFNGEPKNGSVYRAEDHKKYYRITLSENQQYIGFHLEKDMMQGEYPSWECDIEEITMGNLFDLNISNKDLQMMAEEESQLAEEEVDQEQMLLDDLGSSLFMLNDFDSDIYEAVTKVTTLVSDALASPSYIQIADGLAWDNRTAKVSNISIATYLLESYLNEQEPLKMTDLINAIYQLILETARVHKVAKHSAGI